jgi:predicted TIM-barrel fold metal-dependent hydrolase
MIIDAHCHAWRYWPYQPPVPDPTSRGIVEQLLFEMDQHGIERAAIVCARIDHNPDNNDYVAECVARYPDRLYQLADVDCSWMPTYHTTGAAERLKESVARYGHRGFTHYVRADDDGSWFLSEDGLRFFTTAQEFHQLVSIALPARLQPVLRQLAGRFPELTFLCHHMAGARVAEPSPRPLLGEIIRSAQVPNIMLKLSGFHYVSRVPYGFPFADCHDIVHQLYAAYGPGRLCWGSDYPVLRQFLTYQQALEAFRTYCDFVPQEHHAQILGDNLLRLLTRGG